MNDSPAAPTSTRELTSTVSGDGHVTLALTSTEVAEPRPDFVVVRIEAAPINPSDLGLLLAGGDVSQASSTGSSEEPAVTLPITAGLAALAARFDTAMPAGNEGGGVVVAAGDSDAAQALLGRTVGFVSGNSYAEYRSVHVSQCLVMPEGITSEQAAAPFVNPLTALGMIETMRAEGHSALVHTVGASNLGQMLNRVCVNDGIGLVNVVRQPAHVELLRAQGAEHVVDSSVDSFRSDLVDALRATGATIAFDAIGGGELAGTLLSSMEQVASEGAEFNRYGSDTLKQVYIYGGLDRSPTTLNRNFGMSWSIGGWLLTPFLGKLGQEGTERLRQRVADEIATTFASSYGMRLTLDQVVDPDAVRRYAAMATGDKALITPHG